MTAQRRDPEYKKRMLQKFQMLSSVTPHFCCHDMTSVTACRLLLINCHYIWSYQPTRISKSCSYYSATKTDTWRYLRNRAWFHRSAGVKKNAPVSKNAPLKRNALFSLGLTLSGPDEPA